MFDSKKSSGSFEINIGLWDRGGNFLTGEVA